MTDLIYADDCETCRALRGEIALTNAPRILETTHWVIEHAHPTSVRGWLVLVLARHCGAIHDLTAAELATLGPLLGLLGRALRQCLGAEKECVIQFAE